MRNRLDDFFSPLRMIDQMEREFRQARRTQPAVNVGRDGDTVTAIFELPGASLDAIDVEVDGTDLTIAARRDAENAGDNADWGLRERGHGQTRRTVRLPFEIDRDAVAAHYADGLLTVTLPRAEADKPARIEVLAG